LGPAVSPPGRRFCWQFELVTAGGTISLSHRIFGEDWQRYFDWTYHGIDRVSVRTLANAFAPPD
jgi:hypothetical protein